MGFSRASFAALAAVLLGCAGMRLKTGAVVELADENDFVGDIAEEIVDEDDGIADEGADEAGPENLVRTDEIPDDIADEIADAEGAGEEDELADESVEEIADEVSSLSSSLDETVASWVRRRRRRRRAPTTGCNWRCYLGRYRDLQKAFGTNTAKAAKHWQSHGWREKRDCTCPKGCNWQCYLSRYPDLQKAFGRKNTAKATVHWFNHGKGEKRDCTCPKGCNWQCYLSRYPDLQRAFGRKNTAKAKEHWFNHGMGEKRDCTCPRPTPTPSPMAAAWANHFEAFGMGVAAQDNRDPTTGNAEALDKIMLDYDEKSVVRLYEYSPSDKMPLSTLTGRAQIRGMFNGLFPALRGCNGARAEQLKAKVDVDEIGDQVFLVWSCGVNMFHRATDTFIFEGAIIRNQNIVVAKTKTAIFSASLANSLVESRRHKINLVYNPVSVSEAWTNHAEAFMAGAAAGGSPPRNQTAMNAAVKKIMLDYDNSSVVRLFTQTSGLTNNFDTKTGLAQIKAMFTGLFQSFSSAVAPVVPQALVVDDPKQVFLIWRAPDSGYDEATDTFIFDSDFKINRQNIALFTPSLR